MRRVSNAVFALACAAMLAGCGIPRALGIAPYKIEIQQGNFLSQEMVSQLKEGMTKEQVRQIIEGLGYQIASADEGVVRLDGRRGRR